MVDYFTATFAQKSFVRTLTKSQRLSALPIQRKRSSTSSPRFCHSCCNQKSSWWKVKITLGPFSFCCDLRIAIFFCCVFYSPVRTNLNVNWFGEVIPKRLLFDLFWKRFHLAPQLLLFLIYSTFKKYLRQSAISEQGWQSWNSYARAFSSQSFC